MNRERLVALGEWARSNRFALQGWFWVLCLIPTLVWWKDSVLWVALMSIYANAATAFTGHEAHRARKNSEQQEQTS